MLDLDNIDAAIQEIATLNALDLATAEEVFYAVGDRHMLDDSGLLIANLADGRCLHVRWPQDEDEIEDESEGQE